MLDADGSVLDTCGGVSDTDIKGPVEVVTFKRFNHAFNPPTALFFSSLLFITLKPRVE